MAGRRKGTLPPSPPQGEDACTSFELQAQYLNLSTREKEKRALTPSLVRHTHVRASFPKGNLGGQHGYGTRTKELELFFLFLWYLELDNESLIRTSSKSEPRTPQ
ncbi:Hypothetical predicted protein [Olea europaea subsp. europaea]|uniref:Uncharacterized protein n=1 Tax=Olea europaea subsp. europaea TaxID=158383 RepID=A0A8S0PEY8_OLEEU|nr:Hypothetical predicted protein [Olea europaea subsp. europaea]